MGKLGSSAIASIKNNCIGCDVSNKAFSTSKERINHYFQYQKDNLQKDPSRGRPFGNNLIFLMANITGKNAIFFVTSPRTPFKMIDEIRLLHKITKIKNGTKKLEVPLQRIYQRLIFLKAKLFPILILRQEIESTEPQKHCSMLILIRKLN